MGCAKMKDDKDVIHVGHSTPIEGTPTRNAIDAGSNSIEKASSDLDKLEDKGYTAVPWDKLDDEDKAKYEAVAQKYNKVWRLDQPPLEDDRD